jgi:hypothetical protein
MMVLSLVRNYLPAHQYAVNGGWNIADCVSRSYDLEGMHFGTLAAGRKRWHRSFGQDLRVFKWNRCGNQAADFIAGSMAKYASSGV